MLLRNVSLILFLFLLCTISSFSQQSPCNQAEYRAFDFWIGNWRVETPEGQLAGFSRVEQILDDCVIFENWTGASKFRGKSFNHYDQATRKWKQKWTDNFGGNLEFTGTVQNGTARYTCTSLNNQTGKMINNKMTITKVSENEVRQVWEQSGDGLVWTKVFDGKYIRINDINEDQKNREVQVLLDSLYSSITFDEGQKPRFGQLRDLFVQSGIMVNSTGTTTQTDDVNSFTAKLYDMYVSGTIRSFYEKEVKNEIEIFGKVAQCKSYYKTYLSRKSENPLATGVNLVQMVLTEDGWKIASIIWDTDSQKELFNSKF